MICWTPFDRTIQRFWLCSTRSARAPFHERDVEYQPGRVFLGSVLDKVHAFDMPPRPVALSEID